MMVVRAEFRRVIFVRPDVLHAVFEDLELAVNVKHYTAEERIVDDV